MTAQDLATTEQPAPPAADKPSKPLTVGGKLKTALDLMVFGPVDGPEDKRGIALAMDAAAKAAGVETRYIRKALDKPHVRQYLNAAKQVFRAGASAANISRAVQIRDQDDNKTAAIQAIRYLDELDAKGPNSTAGRVTTPGVVIHIHERRHAATDDTVIEVNPLIEHADTTHDT